MQMVDDVEHTGQQQRPPRQQSKHNRGIGLSHTLSEEARTIDTVSIRSGSSNGSNYYYSKNKDKVASQNNVYFNDGPLGTSIEITPKKMVKLTNTIPDTSFGAMVQKTSFENAPQKKIKAVSKQYVIRGRKENRNPNLSVEHRPHSLSRTDEVHMVRSRSHSVSRSRSQSVSRNQSQSASRSRSQSVSRNQSQSVSRSRSQSVSRNQSLGRDPNSVRSRSISAVPRSRPPSTYHTRSRSQTRSESVSRSRSHSRHSIRTTSHSVSSASSVTSKHSRTSEPNVHHDAVLTTIIHIECPTIVEMKENELFARKAGIDFTREGGDALTFIHLEDNHRIIQDESHTNSFQLSPKQKHASQSPSSDDIPENATFFRDEGESRHIIETDKDLAQLRTTAGQLWSGWAGKRIIAPTIARRIRDFQFAQEKRRLKFGNERPWGILGLYDHLSAVRTDVEWAEIAACRRSNGEPYKAWFEMVDEKSTGKNRPFFTYIILCICSGFMLASIAVNGWKIEPFSVNPMIGPSAETLTVMGAKDSYMIVQEKEVWRLLSAMVLHAGFVHFVLNMAALYFVGSAIEFSHGFVLCMIMFVVPAIGGSIFSAIFLPSMISVGASGGIFGLIGACLADIFMNWGLLFNEFVNGKNKYRHIYVLLVLLVDVIINCLIGLTPFVDNFTHLGGMVIGFFIGLCTMKRIATDMFEKEQRSTSFFARMKRNFSRIFWGTFVVFTICISFTILMRGDGVTTPCKSCNALSCVAFPPWADKDKKWWYCDDCGSVSADARINPLTKEFDQISMNCPNGNIFVMDITQDMSSDRDWLEERLPGFCRLHCLDRLHV